jgi:uncharacterized protein (DUF2267 family)
MSDPPIIDRSAQQAHTWLSRIAAELGVDDQRDAYRALRGVLHTIRDRLTVEESAQLAAQLPTLIRGIYYEGWKPSRVPETYDDVDSFLERVTDVGRLNGRTQASIATQAVAKVLAANVSPGEFEDVLGMLPESLRRLLRAADSSG